MLVPAIIEAVWDKLWATEAKDLGFEKYECVDCGEPVLVSGEQIDNIGSDWYYDRARHDQAFETWMIGGDR